MRSLINIGFPIRTEERRFKNLLDDRDDQEDYVADFHMELFYDL